MPLNCAGATSDFLNFVVDEYRQFVAPDRCDDGVLFVYCDEAPNGWNAFFGQQARVLNLKERTFLSWGRVKTALLIQHQFSCFGLRIQGRVLFPFDVPLTIFLSGFFHFENNTILNFCP